MSQIACRTASVDQTEKLSRAVGHIPRTGGEANVGTDAAGHLVLRELEWQQVSVDFSLGQTVTDTGLLAVRKLGRELKILAEGGGGPTYGRCSADPRSQKFVIPDVERGFVAQAYQLSGGYFGANDKCFRAATPATCHSAAKHSRMTARRCAVCC